jgi:hypothetical protein
LVTPALRRSEEFRHRIDEGLDADETGLGPLLGAMQQMLAAAEADFEHDALRRMPEQTSRRPGGAFQIDLPERQQPLQLLGLARTQRLAAAAAVKRLGRDRVRRSPVISPRELPSAA